MDSIIKHLKLENFEDQQIDKILSAGKVIHIPKGQCFLKINEKCDKVGLVINGLLYNFNYNNAGDKDVSDFYYPGFNDVVTDYECFIRQTKSTTTITALEDSEIVVFNNNDIQELYIQFPKLLESRAKIIRFMYLKSLHLVHVFRTTNATERIKKFQNCAPEIFKKVPYSYIASYLGIHRNTFNTALKKL